MFLDPNYNINSYLKAAKLVHEPRSPLGFYGGKGSLSMRPPNKFGQTKSRRKGRPPASTRARAQPPGKASAGLSV